VSSTKPSSYSPVTHIKGLYLNVTRTHSSLQLMSLCLNMNVTLFTGMLFIAMTVWLALSQSFLSQSPFLYHIVSSSSEKSICITVRPIILASGLPKVIYD